MSVRHLVHMMSLLAWVTPVALAAGCDYDAHNADDAADASDAGPDVWVQSSALGADPASGMMLAGDPDYSPDDAELARLAHLVVLGNHGAVGAVRVVHGPQGPVLLGPDDRVPTEATVIDAPLHPDDDPRTATGRWLVAAGRPVLVQGPDVDLAWAKNTPSTTAHGPTRGHTFVARLPVATDRIPAEARALVDATVRVFSTEREVCIAKVTGFELEARLVHEPLGPWDPAYSDAEIFARGLRTLVATIAPLDGADPDTCVAGVVAVGVDAPSPRLFAEVEPTRKQKAQAIDAMCALPAWRERITAIEAQYDDELRLHWSHECRMLERRAEVRAFTARDGVTFVIVDDHDLVAGFAPSHLGKALTTAWSYDLPYTPAGLIDVQDDGSPELVMPELERAPRELVGLTLGGDQREPTYAPDWTPIAPRRAAVGGFAVPDFSVFLARAPRP